MKVIDMATRVRRPNPSPILITVLTHFTSENSDMTVATIENINRAANTRRNGSTRDAEGICLPSVRNNTVPSAIGLPNHGHCGVEYPRTATDYVNPSRASFMLTKRWPLPMTRWSSNSIPSSFPASTKSRVIDTSAPLGVGSPDGWL